MRGLVAVVVALAVAAPAAAQRRYELPVVSFFHVQTKERKGNLYPIVLFNAGSYFCWLELAVFTPQRPKVIHLHRDVTGAPDPITLSISTRPVIPWPWPGSGSWSGCARVPFRVGRAIVRTPRRFYVDLHTSSFPQGELRARLRGPARLSGTTVE